MADKLQVWQQATVHLGEARLNALTDDVEVRYVFDDAWPGVVAEAFNAGDWDFATNIVSLTQTDPQVLLGGWLYQYDYPSNWERTLTVSNDPNLDEPYDEYENVGTNLYANDEQIFMRYIRNDLMDDADVSLWPTMFWRYVAVFLAYETTERLTQSTTSAEKLDRMLTKALRKAKSVDARNTQGRNLIRNSEWLRAQRGGYRNRNRSTNTFTVGGEIVLGEGDV